MRKLQGEWVLAFGAMNYGIAYDKSVKMFFLSISFLKNTRLWRTFCRMELGKNQTHLHQIQRWSKSLSKAELSSHYWFKPASTLSSKYECLCEFEKDVKLLPLSKNERIRVGESFPNRFSKPFYSWECFFFIFCELMFFQTCFDTWPLLLKYLWFCQTQRLGHSEALCAVNLRRSFSAEIVVSDV